MVLRGFELTEQERHAGGIAVHRSTLVLRPPFGRRGAAAVAGAVAGLVVPVLLLVPLVRSSSQEATGRSPMLWAVTAVSIAVLATPTLLYRASDHLSMVTAHPDRLVVRSGLHVTRLAWSDVRLIDVEPWTPSGWRQRMGLLLNPLLAEGVLPQRALVVRHRGGRLACTGFDSDAVGAYLPGPSGELPLLDVVAGALERYRLLASAVPAE